jgi:hypothetical protein
MSKAGLQAKDDMFFTVTMAELLESQGHKEDALTIYLILVKDKPWDKRIVGNIERLKALMGQGRGSAVKNNRAS